MAKTPKKAQGRKGAKNDHLPLERSNFLIIGAGIVLIIAGYLALSEGSVEGLMTLSVAPILLVLGYCVVVPLGILYHKGMFGRKQQLPTTTE